MTNHDNDVNNYCGHETAFDVAFLYHLHVSINNMAFVIRDCSISQFMLPLCFNTVWAQHYKEFNLHLSLLITSPLGRQHMLFFYAIFLLGLIHIIISHINEFRCRVIIVFRACKTKYHIKFKILLLLNKFS